MSGGYRLAIASALGLAAFVILGTGAYFGALYGTHYGRNAVIAANREASTKLGYPSQLDRDRAGLPALAERAASGPDPKSTDEREKRDLAAQESTSVWTFWMLVVSLLGVLTTMLGTGFLLWQITLTRKAVKDTGDATVAMVRQNAIAEEQLRHTQNEARAWLAISAEPQKILISGESIKFYFRVIVENVGRTMAHDVRVQNAVYDVENNGFRNRQIGKWNQEPHQVGSDVMPGETTSFNIWSFQNLEKFTCADSTSLIYPALLVYVRYKIVGDTEVHTSRRVFRFGIRSDEDNALLSIVSDPVSLAIDTRRGVIKNLVLESFGGVAT